MRRVANGIPVRSAPEWVKKAVGALDSALAAAIIILIIWMIVEMPRGIHT